MKVALYGQAYGPEIEAPLASLFRELSKYNATVVVEAEFARLIGPREAVSDVFSLDNGLDASFDLMISVGGDGTILRAITFIKDLGVPVVGINTGRLGFLSIGKKEHIGEMLSEFAEGQYQLVDRRLVSATIQGQPPEGNALNFALNEITVSRKDTTSMITVETHLNGEYLTSYWADGLIIATPTGSTGYSLSCGGPVIMPTTRSLVITPIAPHNLNARPLVISDETQIKLRVSGRESQHLLSFDSRLVSVENETEIIVQKADFTIRMVEFTSESFLKTIRNKLLWGEDRRN
ncbi:NAD kinase [Robiginitalea aurantiaca]|uniref:NAD kinase n=1 Tax=Robiginitalea aurantiaca TaxID=3056915 RepID=A0ABT7WC64_9FLAO|nr:NAD kinase [Robiginitalea aurantiaca]MDM9630510.1 NAD kinase [Robiginitalea aurantiaca]